MTADAGKDVEKAENSSIVGGIASFKLTLEISLAVLQKIGHCTTRGSHNTILGIYPEAVPTGNGYKFVVHLHNGVLLLIVQLLKRMSL